MSAGKILQGLIPTLLAQFARRGMVPQHLGYLEVEQKGRMQRLTGSEESPRYRACRARGEKDLKSSSVGRSAIRRTSFRRFRGRPSP